MLYDFVLTFGQEVGFDLVPKVPSNLPFSQVEYVWEQKVNLVSYLHMHTVSMLHSCQGQSPLSTSK